MKNEKRKTQKAKVFFTASYYGKTKFQKEYDLVLKKIEECNVEVIGTEKGNYSKLIGKAEDEAIFEDKSLHYRAIKKGIQWADAVIIEMSNEDFQLGHEATLAMQAKKPVLCLSLYEDFSKKVNNPYFFGAKYNEYNVGQVIRNFIGSLQREKLSERFNCFFSKRQVAYLEKKASECDMNMSEYLRKLIREDEGNRS
ncbi:hypothetical protein ACFLY9_01660 [Patescibacteria group bacterium]